jgi:cytoskeletal protein CcmA (bactofilin family)
VIYHRFPGNLCFHRASTQSQINARLPICHASTILSPLSTGIAEPAETCACAGDLAYFHSHAGNVISDTLAEEKMTIFRKSDDNDRQDIRSAPKIGKASPIRSKKASVIGPTLVIKGELSADEDLIIEGQIEGTIAHHKKHLTVGKQGRVLADIHASSVIVEGQLVGDIHSEGMVSLAKGAEVKGNIYCGNIVMEYGARFTGKIDMGDPPKVAVVPNEPVQAEPVQTEKPRKVAGQAAKASVY